MRCLDRPLLYKVYELNLFFLPYYFLSYPVLYLFHMWLISRGQSIIFHEQVTAG